MSTDFAKPNYINGVWEDAAAAGGRTIENRNPANTAELVGVFPGSDAAAVDRAVMAARAAFREWSLTPAPVRGMLLKKVGDILAEGKDEIAALATREMGKILDETKGDVQEGIDTAYQMMGEGRRMNGDTVPCEFRNKFGMSVRMPVGVCGVITPWNFPLAIATWCVFPALICGNTVVLKPAEDTPATAVRLMEAFEKAGFPKGVVNMVCGDGATGAALVDHPGVNLIAFTGSAEVGAEIASKCGRAHKRVCLEMGGKNAQIVMDDANLDLALEGALWGAFGTTGQRCTATSRLILHEKIHDQFLERLVARAREIRIGDGLKPGTQMGPLINAAAVAKYEKYVKIGRDEDGADLLCGGNVLRDGAHANGYFVEPTIFAGVTRAMRIFREEIFAPVLSVVKVASFEEAVETLNDSEYGLSSSIYTNDVNRAFQAMRDLEAGITYINVPTIGAEIQLPFGGTKKTGNGHRESGHQVLDVFSEWKSIYVDFSGRLQRAQIDEA
jgi:aldehyde dehydrogenase (NAD+)